MDKAELYRQVLLLSYEDRLELLTLLIRSLDDVPAADQDDVDRAWDQEIKRRMESLRNGTAELLTSEEAWKIINKQE